MTLAARLARITLREGDQVAANAALAVLTPTLAPMLDERTMRELTARVEAAQAGERTCVGRVGLGEAVRFHR